MHRILSILLFILCCFSTKVSAIDILRIKTLTNRDGLSQNSVYHIFQDKQGFIWFNTFNATDRYDGNEFKTIPTIANESRILQFVEDKKGYIWGKTELGTILRYNPRKEVFTNLYPDEEIKTFDNISLTNREDIWLWGKKGCCRVKCNQEEMQIWAPNENLSKITITSFFEDSQNNIWIGTSNCQYLIDNNNKITKLPSNNGFYNAYEVNGKIFFITAYGINIFYKDTFSSYPFLSNMAPLPRESCLLKDSIILISGKKEIYAFNIQTKHFSTANHLFGNKQIPKAAYITDNKGSKWVYNKSGVLWIYKPDNTFDSFTLIPPEILSLISAERYNIYQDSRGIIWISTFGNGLFAIEPVNKQFKHITTAQGLPTNYLYCVTEDSSGEIWVGTDFAGAVKITLADYPVQTFYPAGKTIGDRNNAVRLIYQDSESKYWFGTRNGELFINDSLLQPISKHRITNGMPYTIAEDTLGNIWLGNKTGEGIMIFPKNGKETAPYIVNLYEGNKKITSIDIFSIIRDDNGRMWIASFGKGLFLAKRNKEKIEFVHFRMPQAKQNKMRGMTKTNDGLIWVGSDYGIIVFDPDEIIHNPNSFTNFHHISDDENSLNHNEIKTIFEDSKGRIWIGTAGGGLDLLIKKSPLRNSTFKHYTSKNGLSNDVIQAIEEDNEGFIWISTENGISKFDLITGFFRNFFLPGNQNTNIFNERSSWRKANGEIMFGSYNGVHFFNPSKMSYDKYAPATVITELQVNGNKITPENENSLLKESISFTKKIILPHTANSFNIKFALLNYADPELNQYTYFLNGYEKNWNTISHNNIAAYRNVSPGKYQFKVKGCNSSGVWNNDETTLEIEVLHPWWVSRWAIITYAIIVTTIAIFAWRIISRMHKLNTAIEVEKQLTEHKFRFFTNISHEFRTPLTIIKGSIESFPEDENIPLYARKQIALLSKSSNRLLRLIDQLLEFRHLQNEIPQMNLEKTEIVAFLKDIYATFKDMASKNKIEFTFESNQPEIYLMIDKDKMEKIAYNLISNAFKNTSQEGKIVMKLLFLKNKELLFSISDNGKGVPEDKRHLLFKQFSRINYTTEGTGIGLYLVSKLITAHNGWIEYSNSDLGGACFSIHIPSAREKKLLPTDKENKIETINHEEKENGYSIDTHKEYKIVIIEDDDEIRGFLHGQVGQYYTIIETSDGKDGLEIALKEQPSLIICDVMLPNMNGFEITKRLKENFQTSHIPIILLTAYTSEEYQLKGIQIGADAYITKPFSLKYLLTRIDGLIKQRKRLQQKFIQEAGIASIPAGLTNKDEDFFNRLHNTINKNINNTAFTIDMLMRDIGMSRTAFFQKVKGITGYPPNEYIRIIRLKKAAELLKTSKHNISEISYMVGFDNPLYFSKCFKVQFEKSPSEYRKSFCE